MCTYDIALSVYMHHVNSVQSTMSPQALVYKHFTFIIIDYCISCLADIFCFIYANNIGKCRHVYNAQEVLTALNILHLEDIFVPSYLRFLEYSLFNNHICFWQMPMKFLQQFIMISHLAAILFLSHLCLLMDS